MRLEQRARAKRAAVVGVSWAPSATPGGGARIRRLPIDPQLRGRVQRRVVDALERRGWHVHRVGAAAYVHLGDQHYLLAVVDRREPSPTWIHELAAHHRWILGRAPAPAREQRRSEALVARWARARIRDRRGRYIGRPAWWQENDGRPLAGFHRPWRL